MNEEIILKELHQLRDEVQGAFKDVRSEIRALRQQMSQFHVELVQTGSEVAQVRKDAEDNTKRLTCLEDRVDDHEKRITEMETSSRFVSREVGEIKEETARRNEILRQRIWEVAKVVLPAAAMLSLLLEQLGKVVK